MSKIFYNQVLPDLTLHYVKKGFFPETVTQDRIYILEKITFAVL